MNFQKKLLSCISKQAEEVTECVVCFIHICVAHSSILEKEIIVFSFLNCSHLLSKHQLLFKSVQLFTFKETEETLLSFCLRYGFTFIVFTYRS